MIPSNRQIIQYMLKHIQEIANIATDFLSWLQVSEPKTRAPPYRQRTDNSSSFLSKDLSKTADLLLRSSLSKFTTSAYKSEYWMYNQFSKKPPFLLPLQHLLAFIAHCYFQRLAASTAFTLVSALSFIVQLSYSADTEHFIKKILYKGFKK